MAAAATVVGRTQRIKRREGGEDEEEKDMKKREKERTNLKKIETMLMRKSMTKNDINSNTTQ